MSVGLEVIDKSLHPGSASLIVRPQGDVLVDAFENRAAQPGAGRNLVSRIRHLNVDGAIIFRRHVLAVALLPDFNSHHWITTLVNVRNLIGAIFGSVINCRTCNQRRMAHGQSTGKEIVHAVVLIAASGDQVVSLVPGIDGRTEKRSGQVRRRTGDHFLVSSALQAWRRPRSGFYAVSRISNRVVPRGLDCTDGQRLKGVADAVSNILRPMSVAS